MLAKIAKNKGLNKFIATALIAIAIVIGVFFLIRAILTFMEPSRAYVPPVTPRADARTVSGPRIDAKIDPSFDAFHRERTIEEVDNGPVTIGEDAPETSLNLVLKGIRASGDGTGSATLELPDGAESVFRQTDTILRNVTLEAIYPNHIIISRSGTQERVTFKRERGELFQPEEGAQKTSAPVLVDPAPSRVRETVGTINQEALSKFTASDFIQGVKPQPVREGANVKGYRLRSINPAIKLSELGIARQDLVTHINGIDLRTVPLIEIENILKQAAKNRSSTSVTIDRDGEIKTLNLE